MGTEQTLKAPPGHYLIVVEMKNKQSVTFDSGAKIQIERGFNFNLREDNPSIGVLLDGDAPFGSAVLIHHNAAQPSYKIYNEINAQNGFELFSIPKDMVFMYYDKEWIPFPGFVMASRIFEPYVGNLSGMEASQVPNRMYIHKGVNEGSVCVTLINCDYEIIFFVEGKEKRIIRTREREMLGIDHDLTEKVKNGEYLIGLNPRESRKLEQWKKP